MKLKNWSGQIVSWALSFTVFEQMGPAAVLSVLLTRLGASPAELGLLIALLPLGMAGQALGVPALEEIRSRRRSLVLLTLASALPYVAMAVGVQLLSGPLSTRVVILASFAILSGLCGLREVAYFEIAGATIERRRRGRFFGLRDAVTAAAGMGGGFAVLKVLSHWDDQFPTGYALLLAGGSVAVVLAGLALLLSTDSHRAARDQIAHPFHLLASLPQMLAADRRLRLYLAWRTLIQASRCTHAFLIVYLLKRFALGDKSAGVFLMVAAVCRLVAGLPCGWITDRWGAARASVAVAALCALVPGLAILAGLPSSGVGLAYVALAVFGIFQAMWFSADSAISLNLTTPDLHLRYVSLARVVPLPVSLVTPVVAGLLASRWGYAPAFALGAALGVAAMMVGLRAAAGKGDQT